MATTCELIAKTTLGSDAANIEFTSIPGTYTDLVLVVVARSTRNASGDGCGFRVNGDTGSNYSITLLRGTGSAADSSRESNATAMLPVDIEGATATADTFSIITYQIMSYSNTNVYKTVLISNAAVLQTVRRVVGLWRSTSAITSVKVYPSIGPNFKAGSTAALYGIKASA